MARLDLVHLYSGSRIGYFGVAIQSGDVVTVPDTPQPTATDAEADEDWSDDLAVVAPFVVMQRRAEKAEAERDALAATLTRLRDELQAAIDWMDCPDGDPNSSTLVDRWRALLSDTPDTDKDKR